MIEKRLAKEIERRLRDDDDVQILKWFEQQIISARSVRAAMTRGVAEEYDQLSDLTFSRVVEWLIPRFWADSTDAKRARRVVACLRQAYILSVLPEPWLDEPRCSSSYAPSGVFPDGTGLRSVATVAYWAYFMNAKGGMSAEQELKNLSMLSRWTSAASFMQAFAGLETHSLLFTKEGTRFDLLADLTQAMALTHIYDGYERRPYDERPDMTPEMVGDVQNIVRQLIRVRATSVSQARELYAFHLGSWIKSTASKVSKSHYNHFLTLYREHQTRLVYNYFSGLLSWTMPSREEALSSEEAHFPVTENTPRTRADGTPYARLQLIWMEEQFVRRLMYLLINQHAADTSQEQDAVILGLRGPQFILSVSEDTFQRLYDQALEETAARVATEQGYDYAWRAGCAAMVTMHDVCSLLAGPKADDDS